MVTIYNKDYMQSLVDQEKANYVLRDDGKTKINLQYAMNKKGTSLLWGDLVIRNGVTINPFQFPRGFELREGDAVQRNGELIKSVDLPKKKPFLLSIGDTVERQLKNGDIILFNRQPTLHRGSMLAKRIIVRPNKTFRFNLASTKSFNAKQYWH